jgi:hypothetical protein
MLSQIVLGLIMGWTENWNTEDLAAELARRVAIV